MFAGLMWNTDAVALVCMHGMCLVHWQRASGACVVVKRIILLQ